MSTTSSRKIALEGSSKRSSGATAVAVNGELAAMRSVSAYLRANPDKLKQLAFEMKIHTKSGKLTKAYGG